MLDTAQRGAARFPHAVRRVLLTALALRDRRDAGTLAGHGLAASLGRLDARTTRLLAGRLTHPLNRRLLQHLRTERPALFTCLRRADVEATNWQAEQASRPAVVTRKVCGGNLLDVSSQSSADQLPGRTRGIMYVGDYDSTCDWQVSDRAHG